MRRVWSAPTRATTVADEILFMYLKGKKCRRVIRTELRGMGIWLPLLSLLYRDYSWAGQLWPGPAHLPLGLKFRSGIFIFYFYLFQVLAIKMILIIYHPKEKTSGDLQIWGFPTNINDKK